MLALIPSRTQWKRWSLPSKLTCIGAYVGLLSVLLAVVFYLLPAANTVNKNVAVSQSRFPEIQFSNELASLETYCAHWESLNSHFAEQAEFGHQVIGQGVIWRGVVESVSDSLFGNKTTLIFSSTNKDLQHVMQVASASFPSSFRLRLFALRPGDVVRIAGSIDATQPHAGPSISATNFWLEQP
jgi:hypothetical protein